MRQADQRVAAANSKFRGLLVLVSAIVLVDTIFFTALTPLLPHYVHTLGLSKAQAGMLVAAYPAGTLLGALPGGMIATRLGVRPAVLLGLGLMSGATLVFGFAHSAAILDLARFVQGFAGACTWAGSLAWLTAAAPAERRGSALGVAFGAAVSGALLGPVVGAAATRVGTGPAFAAATVGGVILMVASLLFPRPLAGDSQTLRSALPALRDPGVAGGMWLTALAGLGFGAVDVLAPLRLSELGAGALVIGAAFLGSAALESGLAPLVGRMADRRGRLAPVRISLAGAVVVSLLAPVVQPAWVLVALLVIGLPAYGTLFVPAAAMISDGADRRHLHQGLGFGLANLAWAGGQAVAASSSGAIAQAAGDVVPYVLLALASAVTLAALRPGGRRLVARLGVTVSRPAA